ncbi:hypothetical protein ACFLSK_01280 [Chloroflexota bacterium]
MLRIGETGYYRIPARAFEEGYFKPRGYGSSRSAPKRETTRAEAQI